MTTTLPYAKNSRTSRAGAIAAAPGAKSQHKQCVAYVRDFGPCTRAEMGEALHWKMNKYTRSVAGALASGELSRGEDRICKVSGFLAGTVFYNWPKPEQKALL